MKIWEIVRLIEESPVKAISYHDSSDVTFETPEGHTFDVFFDCGEPDYLHWLSVKGGERVNFWAEHHGHNSAAYLASNLIAMPHVSERLKQAAIRAGFTL